MARDAYNTTLVVSRVDGEPVLAGARVEISDLNIEIMASKSFPYTIEEFDHAIRQVLVQSLTADNVLAALKHPVDPDDLSAVSNE